MDAPDARDARDAPPDERRPTSDEHGASTARVDAFSDGVFAIAITLLILEIKVPPADDPGGLLAALLARWPSYGAYVVSFVSIGIMWANHHSVMAHVRRTDRGFHLVTVLFLMTVSFIPFPTAVLAEHLHAPSVADRRTATVFFGLSYLAMALGFNALWRYARRYDLLHDPAHRGVREISERFRFGPWIYLAVTLVAFVSVPASLAGFAALAAFWAVAGWRAPEPDDGGGARPVRDRVRADGTTAER